MGETEEVMTFRLDPADKRALKAIARAADRTPGAEVRRIVKLWIRGELQERRPATRPAGEAAHDR